MAGALPRIAGSLPGSWRLPGRSPLVVERLPQLATLIGAAGQRPLVTADPGIVAAGIAPAIAQVLDDAPVFSDFGENPTETQVAAGAAFARRTGADCVVGVGGGSSLDLAKGIGFVLAGGGRMEDYRGYDRCPAPLPPLFGVPTTAGTGSEAQSFALISRDRDHAKLACGAPSAMFRAVLLEPGRTRSAPPAVARAAGFDAVAHAVETAVSKARTPASHQLSLAAFALLARAFPAVAAGTATPADRRDQQLGAFLAGAAIERSMLGAAHATANPLTRRYGIAHGAALAITLPRVVRWNRHPGYRELLEAAGIAPGDHPDPAAALADLLEEWVRAAELPARLHRGHGELSDLAAEAAGEWTGRHNPRAFAEEDALGIYRACS